MSKTVIVRGARQLLTLHGATGPRRGEALRDLGIIEDGSLLITNGVISNVGPTRRLENLAAARSAEEINATGRVVMPGCCDPSVHLVGPPPRALDYPLGRRGAHVTGSELSQAAQHFLKTTPPGRLEFQSMRVIERFIRHGTTSMGVQSGFGLDEVSELKALRVTASSSAGCAHLTPSFLALAPAPGGTPEPYISWLSKSFLPKIRSRRLATYVGVSCEPAGFTLDQARSLLSAAGRQGFRLNLEADQKARMGAVHLAANMEIRGVYGLNFCDEYDAEILARSPAVGVLLPTPVYHGLDAKFAPARMLIDAGAAIALGTGYFPAMSGTFNMQSVLSLAYTEMGMTAEEAISAATINAAHALDRGAVSGSLEFGKEADLVMLDLPDYREIPYHLGVNLVEMTMRKGVAIYREGQVSCAVQ
jgi:imidazolonepropionase